MMPLAERDSSRPLGRMEEKSDKISGEREEKKISSLKFIMIQTESIYLPGLQLGSGRFLPVFLGFLPHDHRVGNQNTVGS